MTDYVIVAFKVPKEKAQAYLDVFPNAKIIEKPEKKEPEIVPLPVDMQEVAEFCFERNSPVDPARFFNYYEGRGWLDASGKPLTNWKQKVIDWERNGKDNRPIKPSQVQAWNCNSSLKKIDLTDLDEAYANVLKKRAEKEGDRIDQQLEALERSNP